jgi:hypothetical protein
MPSDGKSSHCLWQGELKIGIEIHVRIFKRISRNLFKMGWGWVLVLNATFNNISAISWLSVLLMEETGVPRENH